MGVVGDLEKAFLQLSLREEDRNVCCFLWLNVQGEIEVYRYKKVFLGAKSSPFLLQAVLKQHLESFISESEMASQLLRNLYMDDPVNSMENTEKAREFWHEAVPIFKDGGFNLRKFRSNDENLLHEFSGTQVQQRHKVLGVSWDELMKFFHLLIWKIWYPRNLRSEKCCPVCLRFTTHVG